MSVNTRRGLSLSDKIDILEKYDYLPKMRQGEAASKLNLSQSVLGRIFKNREDIECEALKNESQSRKRNRCGKDDTMGGSIGRKKKKIFLSKKTHEKQGDADLAGAHFWLENEWPSLISKYSPSDVFNADETGLYFKALP
ncbi:Homeobox domain-like [Cinara cedri]|uniref:Homeobox domain-like n=1 Tax=Cinara cedri TaxID=506608 RepID=A0A5E4NF80_9HEMI|nr:Homeobox domain-like [Cinara cedri]